MPRINKYSTSKFLDSDPSLKRTKKAMSELPYEYKKMIDLRLSCDSHRIYFPDLCRGYSSLCDGSFEDIIIKNHNICLNQMKVGDIYDKLKDEHFILAIQNRSTDVLKSLLNIRKPGITAMVEVTKYLSD